MQYSIAAYSGNAMFAVVQCFVASRTITAPTMKSMKGIALSDDGSLYAFTIVGNAADRSATRLRLMA